VSHVRVDRFFKPCKHTLSVVNAPYFAIMVVQSREITIRECPKNPIYGIGAGNIVAVG
jgi:hypothetical protein